MTRKTLSARERVARDQQIVADRLKPMSWTALGKKYGLDERTCRKIYHDWTLHNQGRPADMSQRDPIDIVWESVGRYEGWIEQLALVAHGPETPESVRVSAISAQMSAQQKLTELLQATGILPKQLGKLRIEADVRYVAQAILQVFQEEDVPVHVRQRVAQAIQSATTRN